MPAALAPIRILLGLLCAFFAYYLGRAVAGRIEARATNAQVMRWSLRVLATGLGAAWGGSIFLTLLLLGLVILSGGAGFYAAMQPHKTEEDLTKQMFPKE